MLSHIMKKICLRKNIFKNLSILKSAVLDGNTKIKKNITENQKYLCVYVYNMYL